MSEPSSLKEYIEDKTALVVSHALDTILSDECWRSFGYKKRPKHGRIFTVFMDKHKVQTEHFIYREVLICVISQYLKKSIMPSQYFYCFCDNFMNKLLRSLYLDALNSTEAETYFRNVINSYINSKSICDNMLCRYEMEFGNPAPENIKAGALITAVAMEYLPDISHI